MYVRCLHIELFSEGYHQYCMSLLLLGLNHSIRVKYSLLTSWMTEICINSTLPRIPMSRMTISNDSDADTISPLPPPLKNVKFPMVNNNYTHSLIVM